MTVDKVTALVESAIEPPQWGFLGQARVNVLLLNVSLDAADPAKKAAPAAPTKS
jgi:K+-transporting ATPase c subunit